MGKKRDGDEQTAVRTRARKRVRFALRMLTEVVRRSCAGSLWTWRKLGVAEMEVRVVRHQGWTMMLAEDIVIQVNRSKMECEGKGGRKKVVKC